MSKGNRDESFLEIQKGDKVYLISRDLNLNMFFDKTE